MTDGPEDSNENAVPETPETAVTNGSEENTRCVRLPDDLRTEIDRRVSATNFESVDEYVAFVLESLLREIDQQDDDVVVDVREETSDDIDGVEDQLESLGYL